MPIKPENLPVNPNISTATVGKDYLLMINTGTFAVPVWTVVGGQRNSKPTEKADSIDVSGLVMLNDAGVEALEVAFRAGKTVDVKLQYPDKSYQRGWAAVTEFSKDVPHDGAATLSGTLDGNGPISEVTKASGAGGSQGSP